MTKRRYTHSENTPIEAKLECRADRFVAYIIDILIFVFIGGALGGMYVLTNGSAGLEQIYEESATGFNIASILLILAYRIFFILKYSATPGQLIMKMRYVATETETRLSDAALIKQAVFRPLYNAIPIISIFVVIVEIGVFFTRKDKRSLSNVFSNVLVMKASEITQIGVDTDSSVAQKDAVQNA